MSDAEKAAEAWLKVVAPKATFGLHQAMRESYLAGYAAAMQWRPIESAPKDGTWVLLKEQDSHLYPTLAPCVVAMWGKLGAEDDSEIGWFVSQENCFEFTNSVDNPTGWLPLPPSE